MESGDFFLGYAGAQWVTGGAQPLRLVPLISSGWSC